MNARSGLVLLGTVAIEPNRWATLDPSGSPHTDVAEWLDPIADAGFDGLELWDRHLPEPAGPRAGGVETWPLPVTVFNSYASFDEADDDERIDAARKVAESGALAVKFNVGNDAGSAAAYASRLARWVNALPPGVQALCECHAGISIAEEPAVAARLFDAADVHARVGAIVHTHEPAELIRRRFEAYGPRISHVHVNELDEATMTAPRLADRRDDLLAKVRLLRELGFSGSWTVEFVAGLLTDRDEPGVLIEQAHRDLGVLREVLEVSSA